MGGWLGKFIGGTVGGPVEGKKEISHYTTFPEEAELAAPNGDTDIQLIWLDTLQKKGIYITSEDLTKAWLDHMNYPYFEFGFAKKNFLRGIYPPTSGWFNNSFHMECMNSIMRSEIWGFICPGNPELAAEYAHSDAVLDHAGNSIWGEVFLSSIESALFFENNIQKLLDIGLSFIPKESRVSECVRNVRNWTSKYENWRYTRQLILNTYGHPIWVNALQNIGFTVMSLLYSNGDIGRGILTAVNSGYDADCTCATTGAILGAIKGAKKIPSQWKDPMHDRFGVGFGVVGIERENSISKLSEETCEIGILVAQTRNTAVIIKDAPSVSGKVNCDKSEGIRIEVDYQKCPNIGYTQPREISIIIHNKTEKPTRGTFTIKGPEGWRIKPRSHRLTVKEYDSSDPCVFSISIPETIRRLPSANLFHALFQENRNTLSERHFGLAGNTVWTILGPFWSATKPLDNEADLFYPYLPEPNIDNHTAPDLKSDQGPFFERRIVEYAEDRMDLDHIFGAKGPIVLYLLQYVESPGNRKAWFHVGSNDGLIMWLNDERIFSGHCHSFPKPYNHSIEVNLIKGTNKVLIKVIRCSSSLDFSFGIAEHKKDRKEYEDNIMDTLGIPIGDCWPIRWFLEHWMVDLSSVPPWAVGE
jgi:ADP-ribosylglycohydrolase